MNAALFSRFSEMALERAGLKLPPTKNTMLEHRLGKRARQLGLSDLKEYLDYLQHEETEWHQFLDAVSTNFTQFLREPDHFHLLSQLVEQQFAGQTPLTCWSVACSTGEEPLSIAIAIEEARREASGGYRILATDICTDALTRARRGRYSANQLAVFSAGVRERYFEPSVAPGELVARRRILDRVTFARLNLARTPFPMRGPFDVIFCRNVMIYFAEETKQRLVGELGRLLADDGLLLIGHSETLSGLEHRFQTVRPSVFRKSVAG